MGYSRSVSLLDAGRLARMVSENFTEAELAERLNDVLEPVQKVSNSRLSEMMR